MIGTKLAHYEITAHLGSGGMGEVYQATDLKLKRNVAIKLLPAEFSSDPERLSRFRREAQLLASLNHPNIAHIYGLEESGDKRCIVMELVEGETLQSRLKRGPIPVDEALGIAKQICEALEAAHEKGVIHRDLKPGNVMLTGDGKVKVLDFGLAKAMEPDASNVDLSNSPTMMSGGSMPGVILGTAAYMSPEQARGRKVDRRADIFAFGCVLYEMLTGKRAFDGEDTTEILGRVVTAEPDWSSLPGSVPSAIQRLLQLCLEKNPKNRRDSAADVRLDIEQALKEGPELQQQRVEFVPVPLWKRAIPVVLGLALAAIAAFAVWMLKPAPPPSTAVARFPFTLPEGQSFGNGARQLISIAPDGSQFVYLANNRLYLKPMAEMFSLFIQGTEIAAGVVNPVFSPDGRSIAFYSNDDSTVKRIAVSGGAAVTICKADAPFGMSWGTDDNILVGQGSKGIVRVPASGGKPETIVTVKDGELAHGPRMLPGGDAVLFTLASIAVMPAERWNKAQIVVQSLRSGERKVLIEGGSDATYLSTGHLLYALSGNLLAVPFDLRRLAVTGRPVPVIEGIRASTLGIAGTGTSQFSVSNNGSLVFISGDARSSLEQLTWFDRTGKTLETPGEPGYFPGINVSPDGKRFAVHRHEGAGGDIWVYDASNRAPMRLTFDATQENAMPVWSPEGKRIVFQSLRNGKWGLYQKNSDGTGAEELLIESELLKVPMAWSRNGPSIVFVVTDPKTSADIWLLPLTGDRKATPLLDSKFMEVFPQISPDGKWLAYMSMESGVAQVYVKPFPVGDGKWQVSTGEYGSFPRWRGDGKELFYLTGINEGQVMSVEVNGSGSNFIVGTPKKLFEPSGAYGNAIAGHQGNYFVYDVSPDGQRFLMPQLVSSAKGSTPAAPTINVILNWTSLLKK